MAAVGSAAGQRGYFGWVLLGETPAAVTRRKKRVP